MQKGENSNPKKLLGEKYLTRQKFDALWHRREGTERDGEKPARCRIFSLVCKGLLM